MLAKGQCGPKNKAEHIKTFAPKHKAALLKSKTELSNTRGYFVTENNAGEWELYTDSEFSLKKRYELRMNNSHMGYFPSIIKASRTIAEVTYIERFR